MRVIKQGVNPATVQLRGTCNNCRTEVEFSPIEAKFSSDQRDGDFYTVECPTCSKSIHVNKPSGYNGPYG